MITCIAYNVNVFRSFKIVCFWEIQPRMNIIKRAINKYYVYKRGKLHKI